MLLRAKRTRIALAALYFIVAYGILFYYTYGDYFCSSSRTGQSHAIVTARLALACTAWDIFASACGALGVAATRRYSHWSGIAPLLSTLVSELGFAYMPFWINEGSGRLLYQHTWVDVSCFFTEGNGIGFLFVVAPVLATATLVREWLVLKAQRQQVRHDN